jgi:hypothetical protein
MSTPENYSLGQAVSDVYTEVQSANAARGSTTREYISNFGQIADQILEKPRYTEDSWRYLDDRTVHGFIAVSGLVSVDWENRSGSLELRRGRGFGERHDGYALSLTVDGDHDTITVCTVGSDRFFNWHQTDSTLDQMKKAIEMLTQIKTELGTPAPATQSNPS